MKLNKTSVSNFESDINEVYNATSALVLFTYYARRYDLGGMQETKSSFILHKEKVKNRIFTRDLTLLSDIVLSIHWDATRVANGSIKGKERHNATSRVYKRCKRLLRELSRTRSVVKFVGEYYA